jgi:Uma2 family endonuclease
MSARREYPQRHLVTAEEYLRMGETGVFAPNERLELIEGEIVEMAPIGSPHAGRVNILNRLLTRRVGDRAVVAVQNPMIAGMRSVPQPDLALLAPRADAYTESHPTAADVLLLIEVSDSTLGFDLGAKLALYARSAIPEVWVVDIGGRAIRAFREPAGESYRESLVGARPDDRIMSAALAEAWIEVRELFPA